MPAITRSARRAVYLTTERPEEVGSWRGKAMAIAASIRALQTSLAPASVVPVSVYPDRPMLDPGSHQESERHPLAESRTRFSTISDAQLW